MEDLGLASEVKDLFGGTWEPEVIEDSDQIDFSKPIRGKYECEVKGISYNSGEKQDGSGDKWENLTLKLKVSGDLEGDNSYGRFLDKTFWLGTSDWNDDPDKGKKDLCNCLYTAGLELPSSVDNEAFVTHGTDLEGKKMFVSAYPNKKGKQVVRVVKELKLKEKEETTGQAMPFNLD